jgi:hypothetical protein
MKARVHLSSRLAALALFAIMAVGGRGLHMLPGCRHGCGAPPASQPLGQCCESHGHKHDQDHHGGPIVVAEAEECAICKWLTQAKLPICRSSEVAVFAPPADYCLPSIEARVCSTFRTALPRGPPAQGLQSFLILAV